MIAAVRFTAKTFNEIADGFKSAIGWVAELPPWLFVWWGLTVIAAVLAAHA